MSLSKSFKHFLLSLLFYNLDQTNIPYDQQSPHLHPCKRFMYPSAFSVLISRDRNKKPEKAKFKMACFVPFNSRNLDISFFIFRPTVVLVEELVDELKRFSVCTESLGCVQSSIFRSIHGNLVIWYGAWMKRSNENKDILTSAVLPMLTNLSSMAILLEHNFVDPYAGESREGCSVAKFYTGDIIFMNIAIPSAGDLNDLSYAILALFRDRFMKMEGAISGVCLKCHNIPTVSCLYVWKSLQCCYSWILNTDFRKNVLPYLDRFKLSFKYDVFRVVFVSTENALSCQNVVYPAQMVANEGESSKEEQQVMQI